LYSEYQEIKVILAMIEKSHYDQQYG
jgi:hypothetical protein